MFCHVTLASKNLRFVHDIDARQEQGQRRIFLTEVTDNPVEVVAQVAFGIEPCHRDRLGGRGKVFLHARFKAKGRIGANVFPGAESKVQVGRNEFILFHIRHVVEARRVVIGTESGRLRNRTDGTGDFDAALCVGGINLALNQFLIFYNRGCRSDHRGSKDSGKSLFHIHSLFHVQHPLLEPSLSFG